MTTTTGMPRRRFLYNSALVAGSAMLGACSGGSTEHSANNNAVVKGKGSVTKPLDPPKRFAESPKVAALVKSGKLPPVDKRLPRSPYVIPHRWVRRGKYGGVIHTNVLSTQGAAKADAIRYFFYGHSPLRWLNDGLDVGPGHIQSWSSNKDASVWTFHLREGIRWSDGHPLTTEDILFWWEDIALPGNFAQVPADGFRSGTGKLCTMTAIDELTLRLTYDTPVSLAAEWLALWPKGGIGTTGDIWVLPKHYCKQFHPKYNKNVPKDWDAVGGLWETKTDWMRNPDCPTLLGYKCKSFDNNSGFVLERNPYYWAVTAEGDQLPYVDEIIVDVVQSADVGKVQVQNGKVDYCNGTAVQIDLSDVSTLHGSLEKAGTQIRLWDSASGTGSMFFLNYDYPDTKYRTLFRDARFRRAISYGFDRATVRKMLYFNTGELTTGTVGPKCTEFHTNPDGPGIYRKWRDSHVRHDVALAKKLLAELNLRDRNNDGYVEFPDGGELTVYIDYSADISSTHAAKDDQLVSDMKKIGLRMVRRPVPPQSYESQWDAGKFMAHTNFEYSEAASILTSPRPIVPLDNALWAPLEGAFYEVIGTAKEHEEENIEPAKRNPPRMRPDPNGPIAKMWTLYNKAKTESDPMKRTQLTWDIIRVHIEEGPFFMGCVADYPNVTVVKRDLKNVPERGNLTLNGVNGPGKYPCPASYDPECFYWDKPEAHTR